LSVSRVQDGSRSRSLIYTLHLLYSRSQTEWGGGDCCLQFLFCSTARRWELSYILHQPLANSRRRAISGSIPGECSPPRRSGRPRWNWMRDDHHPQQWGPRDQQREGESSDGAVAMRAKTCTHDQQYSTRNDSNNNIIYKNEIV
jgi:hypothetical protein